MEVNAATALRSIRPASTYGPHRHIEKNHASCLPLIVSSSSNWRLAPPPDFAHRRLVTEADISAEWWRSFPRDPRGGAA
jgi:hypothetical protein